MFLRGLNFASADPTLCTKHPFRAQSSLPASTLCTEWLVRAQTSPPEPTRCTEWLFRAQTSPPEPTRRTECPLRAQTFPPDGLPLCREEQLKNILTVPAIRPQQYRNRQSGQNVLRGVSNHFRWDRLPVIPDKIYVYSCGERDSLDGVATRGPVSGRGPTRSVGRDEGRTCSAVTIRTVPFTAAGIYKKRSRHECRLLILIFCNNLPTTQVPKHQG